MKLYNTLTRKKQDFKPIKEGQIGVYSCGPTVYWNQHIGHMYAYVQWDVLVRSLRYFGFKVKWVMNVTDVGHLESDEDYGEDKMEKGARREGLSVWEVAEKYIVQFKESLSLLNVAPPDELTRATDHIQEQIILIKKIIENGFAYETKRGVVFDTSKFAGYAAFAKLNLSKLKKREDVEDDPEKKKPWDFFLWVKDENHTMKWESPWGVGYPGWHIECTAMSTKYLGNKFDIHTGGLEHIPVHHTNEIAQAFGAFGEKTANYWLHNAWLTAGKEKMSKSLGNFVTVQDLIEKGFDPLALRYLILTSHYRKGLNFSFSSLRSAQTALTKLRHYVLAAREQKDRTTLSPEKEKKIDHFREKFFAAIGDDLNVPQAMAVTWEVIKSNVPSVDKYDLILVFDEILGLSLAKAPALEVPEAVLEQVEEREFLRKTGKFKEADTIRAKIEQKGYAIEDTSQGPQVRKHDA